MAKIPDLSPWGAEFLLCDSAGVPRVLVRPVTAARHRELAERLEPHGFAWSGAHLGFVASHSIRARQLDGIFPGVRMRDGESVRKITPIDKGAWRAGQDDAIAAQDILSGDFEKLCLDIEHGRRGMTRDRALKMIDSAQAAGVVHPLNADRLRRKVDAWMVAALTTPAWYTKIPTTGLPVLPIEREKDGYRRVPHRIAVDAMDAVTRDQLLGVSEFVAYVRPSEGHTHHGLVRFLPSDQPAPGEPWTMLREQPFRLGFMPRQNVERQIADLLMSEPILALDPHARKLPAAASKDTPAQWDPEHAKRTMGREQFIDAVVAHWTAQRLANGLKPFTGFMEDHEYVFRRDAGFAWDKANPPGDAANPSM